MKVACKLIATALAGISSTFAHSIIGRQAEACPSGQVHFDAWAFATSCGDDGAAPTLALDVPIGSECFEVPPSPALGFPIFAALAYNGASYDVSIFIEGTCSSPLATLPGYTLGGCQSVQSDLGEIFIIGSCLGAEGAGDREEDVETSETIEVSEDIEVSENIEVSEEIVVSEDLVATDFPVATGEMMSDDFPVATESMEESMVETEVFSEMESGMDLSVSGVVDAVGDVILDAVDSVVDEIVGGDENLPLSP